MLIVRVKIWREIATFPLKALEGLRNCHFFAFRVTQNEPCGAGGNSGFKSLQTTLQFAQSPLNRW